MPPQKQLWVFGSHLDCRFRSISRTFPVVFSEISALSRCFVSLACARESSRRQSCGNAWLNGRGDAGEGKYTTTRQPDIFPFRFWFDPRRTVRTWSWLFRSDIRPFAASSSTSSAMSRLSETMSRCCAMVGCKVGGWGCACGAEAPPAALVLVSSSWTRRSNQEQRS